MTLSVTKHAIRQINIHWLHTTFLVHFIMLYLLAHHIANNVHNKKAFQNMAPALGKVVKKVYFCQDTKWRTFWLDSEIINVKNDSPVWTKYFNLLTVHNRFASIFVYTIEWLKFRGAYVHHKKYSTYAPVSLSNRIALWTFTVGDYWLFIE